MVELFRKFSIQTYMIRFETNARLLKGIFIVLELARKTDNFTANFRFTLETNAISAFSAMMTPS